MPLPPRHARPTILLLLSLSILLFATLPAAGATTAARPDALAAQDAAAAREAAPAEGPPTLPPLETDLRDRFDLTLDKLALDFAALLAWLPLLVVALLIVLFSVWLGGFVSRRLHLIRLRTGNPYMNGLVGTIVRTMIVLFGLVIALNLLNATALVTAVLGSAGVVGLVLGFAFKDIAENYVAGILLSLRQPFAPGDHVVIDGNELRLPNALVFKAIILNYSRNPNRRFDFTIPIDAAQSIRKAQALALQEICGIDGLLQDPGPSWTVHEYGASGIVLRFFGWVDQRSSDLGKVRSEAIRRVKGAYARAGIEAPRTTYHVLRTDRPGHAPPEPGPEPEQGSTDTSVNRDIDRQLARAQEAAAADTNLLDPSTDTP